jgi:uncharacterized cupredoxin-like copper-binding protein
MWHHRRVGVGLALTISILAVTCDRDVQSVRIAAQDFRFAPDEIRLKATSPTRLTIVNEGREPHEFESPALTHTLASPPTESSSREPSSPTLVRVAPGQHLTITIQPPLGTYLFHCRIRGHQAMTGTIIVE